jgi:hypothetical protein
MIEREGREETKPEAVFSEMRMCRVDRLEEQLITEGLASLVA